MFRIRVTFRLLGIRACRNLELTIDPGVVGQAAFVSFIVIVQVLWTPISLDFKKFDRSSRAVEDMVDGLLGKDVL